MEKYFIPIRDFLRRFSWKVLLLPGLFVLVGGGVIGVLAFTGEPVVDVTADEKGITEGQTRMVVPVLLEDKNSTFLGTILSNETASIYPRRDGIVQDILVDIGDRVQKNQVLARMLPPGVEGESAGMIAEKQAMVNRSSLELKNAEKVAQATLQSVEQELIRKKVELDNAYQVQDTVVQQSHTDLKTTIENQKAKIAMAIQEVESAKTDVSRMTELAQVAVSSSRTMVEKIFYSDQDGLDYSFALQLRNDLFLDLNTMKKSEQSYLGSDPVRQKELIFSLISEANRLLANGQDLLRKAIPTSGEGRQDIVEYSGDLIESQNMLLEAKKDLQEAFNELSLSQKTLSTMEAEQKKMVEMSKREFETTKTMQGTELNNLHEEIAVSEKELQLMRAEQQKMIDREKAELGVYRAVLQQEYAKSGNQEIRSPFTGVISKRMLRVGEMTSPTMAAFELVDVQTSLSKKAKREVQFGLPETFHDALKPGNEVEFFVPTEPDKIYQAVVTRMSPQVDMESRTFTVQAKINDSLIFSPNTSVKVRISSQTQDPVYQIPSQVLIRENDENFLWVVSSEGNEPQRLRVQVLAEDGEFAEISGDLTEQTMIFVDPPVGNSKSQSPNSN